MINQEILSKVKEVFPKSFHIFLNDIIKLEKAETDIENYYLNKEQTNNINTTINSNSKITIFDFKSNKQMAFTIPGLIDKQTLTSFNNITDPINCKMNLYRMNLTGKLNNNIINLHSKISNTILPIFISKELLKTCNAKEITSLYLHEIGHWVNYRMYVPKALLDSLFYLQYIFVNPLFAIPGIILGAAVLGKVMFYFVLLYIIIGICLTSLISAIHVKNEFDCDDFVKRMGYGEYLISAFKKSPDIEIELNDSDKISYLTKKSTIMLSLISPILYSLFWTLKSKEESIETHPNTDRRLKVLLADGLKYFNNNKHLIYENFDETNMNNIQENLKESNLNNINFLGILNSFDEVFKTFDNFIFVNQKSLFPHKIIF